MLSTSIAKLEQDRILFFRVVDPDCFNPDKDPDPAI
jgi:hypothetical protein